MIRRPMTYGLVTTLVLIVLFIPPFALAKTVSVEATGEHILGDNDTFAEAKRLALEKAKRNALEKFGTYLKSSTQVRNFTLTQDEITTYSIAFIKIKKVTEERYVVGGQTMGLKLHIVAVVDSDKLTNQIQSFLKRDDSRKIISRWEKDYDQLREEIAELSRQLKQVSDEKKVALLKEKRMDAVANIQNKEDGLSLLVSGKNLFSSAAFEKDQFDADKRIIRRFLKEISTAYKIEADEPSIQLNVKGASEIIVKGKIILPWNYDTNPSQISVPSFSKVVEIGMMFSDKYVIGPDDDPDSVYVVAYDPSHENRRAKLAIEYLIKETSNISLEVKAGEYRKKVLMKNLLSGNSRIATYARFNVTVCCVPVDDLKTMNKIDIKVIYSE